MGFKVDKDIINGTKNDTRIYKKGEILVREGETSPFFFYLNSGEIMVYNLTDEGKEFLQHKVQPGSFFGEPAVLLEKPFPGTAEVCSCEAEIIKITRASFLEYLAANPETSLQFTMSIARKSLIKSHNLKNLIFLKPEERIGKQLEFYREPGGERNLVNLTRREISFMTGLRVETVIRTVKKMEKDGILEIRNGKIFI